MNQNIFFIKIKNIVKSDKSETELNMNKKIKFKKKIRTNRLAVDRIPFCLGPCRVALPLLSYSVDTKILPLMNLCDC